MGIRNDAGELLFYAYTRYQKGEQVSHTDLKAESGWDDSRLRNALKYLQEKGLVKATLFLGGNFFIDKVLPEGIDIVENEPEFKDTFGVSLNLGILQFSWKTEKK